MNQFEDVITSEEPAARKLEEATRIKDEIQTLMRMPAWIEYSQLLGKEIEKRMLQIIQPPDNERSPLMKEYLSGEVQAFRLAKELLPLLLEQTQEVINKLTEENDDGTDGQQLQQPWRDPRFADADDN